MEFNRADADHWGRVHVEGDRNRARVLNEAQLRAALNSPTAGRIGGYALLAIFALAAVIAFTR